MTHGENGPLYWIGFISGGSSLIMLDLTGSLLQISVKIAVSFVVAFLCGIASIAGKEFYKQNIEKYIKK